MKCQECGKECSEVICDKCNTKIAEDMAKALRKELEEKQKEEGKKR